MKKIILAAVVLTILAQMIGGRVMADSSKDYYLFGSGASKNIGSVTDDQVKLTLHNTPTQTSTAGFIDSLPKKDLLLCSSFQIEQSNKTIYRTTNMTWGTFAHDFYSAQANAPLVKGDLLTTHTASTGDCIDTITKVSPPTQSIYNGKGRPIFVSSGVPESPNYIYFPSDQPYELPLCGNSLESTDFTIKDNLGNKVGVYAVKDQHTSKLDNLTFTTRLSAKGCVDLVSLDYYLYQDVGSGPNDGSSKPIPNKNGFEYVNPRFIVRVYANGQTPILGDVRSITIEAYQRKDEKDLVGTPLDNVHVMLSYHCRCGGFFGGGTEVFGQGTIINGRATLNGSFSEKTTNIKAFLTSDIFQRFKTSLQAP